MEGLGLDGGTPRASCARMSEFDTGVKPSIKENVSTLVDQGSRTVGAIKARVGDVTDTVKEGGSAAIDRTRSFIEANPLQSLAIAFGLGYVAMRIRTSPLVKIAMLAGLGYAGRNLLRS
jgi:hypothetical protein